MPKRFRWFLLIVFFLALIFALSCVQGQARKRMYFPHPYADGWRQSLPVRCAEIHYDTPNGKQVAFYFPPTQIDPSTPTPLWVTFSGNASLALEWT